jgi:hypothetical protein
VFVVVVRIKKKKPELMESEDEVKVVEKKEA